MKINQQKSWKKIKSKNLYLINKLNIHINKNDNLTSYEIVWATFRNPPNNAYVEFDDHPVTIIL